MKFDRNTISNNDTSDRVVLPAGTYRFKVESAIRKQSKKGGMMWELQLSFPDQPNAKWVYDYLTESEKNLWKFAQFFDSIGSHDDDTDAVKYAYGEEGLVALVIEHSDEYGDKNKVKKYLTPSKKEEKKPEQPVLSSDDLPF